ncbi:MAG: flavodoxin family protein, partial [Kamptonema sp. SIO4C4]|nr:flavodoxin family protein [Kamptonema sp. SIO4C4]
MSTVAIVYFSGTGHTHLMAESVADGVRKVEDTKAKLLRITGDQINQGRWSDSNTLNQLEAADAIIFGSPTYMG